MTRVWWSLLAVALVWGCEADPIPLTKPTETVNPEVGVTPQQDMETTPPEDGGMGDGTPDGEASDGEVSDGEVADGGDGGVVDSGALMDVPLAPEEPPPHRRVAVLAGAKNQLAWIKGGEAYVADVTLEGVPVVGDSSRIAESAADRLYAASEPDGDNWVFLPGADGSITAHMVSDPEEPPVELGIWPPLRFATIAVRGDIYLWVVGRSENSSGASAATVILEGEARMSMPDPGGGGVPNSMSVGLRSFALQYPDGTCRGLSEELGDDGEWFCGGGVDSFLVGEIQGPDETLFQVGALSGGGVYMWGAMPGAVEDPEDAEGPRVELAAGGTVERMHEVPDGLLLSHSEDGARKALFLVERDSSEIITLQEGELGLGVLQLGGTTYLVGWDGETVRPTLLAAGNVVDGPSPPEYQPDDGSCSAPRAEDCSADDLDCDLFTRGALCCRELTNSGDASFVPRDASGIAGSTFFLARSNDGPLIASMYGDTVHLMSQGDAAADQLQSLATWAGVLSVEHFDSTGVDVVMVATVQAEEATAKVLLRFIGGDANQEAIPCEEVLGLRLLDDEEGASTGVARVFCPDGARDIDGEGAVSELLAYPSGGESALRWVKLDATGDPNRILAAVGESWALQLWSFDDAEGFVGDQVVDFLPGSLLYGAADDRALPFVLPAGDARVTRVRDGALEVYVRDYGWTPTPATAWPVDAHISQFDAVAVSTAWVEGPEVGDRNLGFFVHDLRAGSTPWGRKLRTLPDPFLGSDLQGTAIGRYPLGEGPVMIRGWGAERTQIDTFEISCGE